MKKVLVFIILCFFSYSVTASISSFEEANTHYRNGEYEEAISGYQSILNEGKESANLYYNLANAYYKKGQLAEAILFYEKALKLNPRDEEIKQNLEVARNSTIDRFEEMPLPIFKSIWLSTLKLLSPSNWARVAIFFFVLFITGLGFYLFSAYKRLSFIFSFSGLIAGILTISFSWFHYNYKLNHKPAILMTASSYVKSGPGKQAEDVFILHEGAKLEITESFEDWQKIRVPDGKIGWIKRENVQEI